MFNIDYNAVDKQIYKDELDQIDKLYNELMNSRKFVKNFNKACKKRYRQVKENNYGEKNLKYHKMTTSTNDTYPLDAKAIF